MEEVESALPVGSDARMAAERAAAALADENSAMYATFAIILDDLCKKDSAAPLSVHSHHDIIRRLPRSIVLNRDRRLRSRRCGSDWRGLNPHFPYPACKVYR